MSSTSTSTIWKGKVAVVTGASSGIGARIAIRLAKSNITVIGLARRIQLIENLNKELTDASSKIHAIACDLYSEMSILQAFEWIRKQFTTIHILICNAGILKSNFLTESSTKDLKDLYDINILGTTLCLREGLRIMRQIPAFKGHIIVMNSILGHRIPIVPVPQFSVYPATKHALTALCRTLRQEIQFFKLNIKLTSINPDMVETDLLQVYSNRIDTMPKLSAEDVAEAVFYVLETPEYVQVEDITLQAVAMHKCEKDSSNEERKQQI